MDTGKAMQYYREFSESRYFDVGNIVKKIILVPTHRIIKTYCLHGINNILFNYAVVIKRNAKYKHM
jgi:hypothetical protein